MCDGVRGHFTFDWQSCRALSQCPHHFIMDDPLYMTIETDDYSEWEEECREIRWKGVDICLVAMISFP